MHCKWSKLRDEVRPLRYIRSKEQNIFKIGEHKCEKKSKYLAFDHFVVTRKTCWKKNQRHSLHKSFLSNLFKVNLLLFLYNNYICNCCVFGQCLITFWCMLYILIVFCNLNYDLRVRRSSSNESIFIFHIQESLLQIFLSNSHLSAICQCNNCLPLTWAGVEQLGFVCINWHYKCFLVNER